MSITRFTPHVSRAYGLIVGDPASAVRAAVPALMLGFAGRMSMNMQIPELAQMAVAAQILGYGLTGILWGRYVARIGGANHVESHFIPRVLAWGLIFILMQGLETAPVLVAGPWLDTVSQPQLMGLLVTQFFQVVIGGMFLLLPHLTMLEKGGKGPSLQEMAIHGGLAIGLGYVLARLPFSLIEQIIPTPDILGGTMAAFALSAGLHSLLQTVGILIVTAYFMLCWLHFKLSKE